MSAADVHAELDDHARELFREYVIRHDIAVEADALRVKARDQLMSWFAIHDANVGTVDGDPVVRYVVFDGMSFDALALKAGEPAIYAAYCTKPKHVESLRLVTP